MLSNGQIFFIIFLLASVWAWYSRGVYHVNHFPTVDVLENILNAYYVSNGWTAYRDFANNHSPGVYTYMAVFFRFFLASSLGPSESLLDILSWLSTFATLTFEAVMTYMAFRLARFPSFFSLLLRSPEFRAWF